MLNQAKQRLSEFSQNKVPMIGFCNPQLLSLSPQACEIAIPLNTQTQNHVDSLYFGALAVRADITCGFLAMMQVQNAKKPIELLFKDFKADFKKRALADTHFHCHEGEQIQAMIDKTLSTQERVNQSILVTATTPSLTQNEIVAAFELTLSLKYKLFAISPKNDWTTFLYPRKVRKT